jgi:hypothetical protein
MDEAFCAYATGKSHIRVIFQKNAAIHVLKEPSFDSALEAPSFV